MLISIIKMVFMFKGQRERVQNKHEKQHVGKLDLPYKWTSARQHVKMSLNWLWLSDAVGVVVLQDL